MTTETEFIDDRLIQAYVRHGVVRPMTRAERMEVPSPSQVSNRTLHERCLAWGCKITRTSGNWVWLISPTQARFKIRPAQQHQGNNKADIDKMLLSIGVPWAEFISAEILNEEALKSLGEGFKLSPNMVELPSDEMGPCSICNESVIRALMAKSGKKIAHKYCVAKPIQEKEKETVPETQINVELEVEPAVELDLTDKSPRQRYINNVFDLLVERGDPMSNRSVAEVLGITASQAGSALAGLTNLGVVTRVKAGVYQANPRVTRKAGTLGLVVSGDGITVDHERSPAEAPTRIVRPEPSWTERVTLDEPPNGNEDETLNELLDLMAPQGFKAKHLPLIDAFKRAALALIREVSRDA